MERKPDKRAGTASKTDRPPCGVGVQALCVPPLYPRGLLRRAPGSRSGESAGEIPALGAFYAARKHTTPFCKREVMGAIPWRGSTFLFYKSMMLKSEHMSATYLRACAAQWLRYDRSMPIVTFERGIKEYHGYDAAPDVLAMTNRRQLIEVEIKVSWSDFKANFKKRIHWMQRMGVYKKPFEYWFLVPPHLGARVNDSDLLTCEGVLTTGEVPRGTYTGFPEIMVLRKPVVNKKAPRLYIKQITKMVKNQSGSLVTMLVSEARAAHHLDNVFPQI